MCGDGGGGCVQSLAVCTSAVMYLMSCDHLAMHIDAASLQLMLRLLSLDRASDDDDFCRTRLRLHSIVQQTGQQATLTLDNMTVCISSTPTFPLLHRILCIKLATIFLPLTLPNTDPFSKFFQ